MTPARVPQQDGETIIVVPCFNEARRLDLAAFATFLDHFCGVSLLFVDDGSTDGTFFLLEKLAASLATRVRVLRLPCNCGKGEAVRQGVLSACERRPSFVGYWDADLATPLDAVDQFRDLLIGRPELTLVMGSRVALLGRQVNRKWIRHVIGRAFATSASLTLGLVVYDTQCGAKLFRATPEIAQLFRQPFRSRWVFDVEILARMVAAAKDSGQHGVEQTIYEYPLDRWTDVRGSQLKLRDFLVAALDLAAIRWQYRGSRATAVPTTTIAADKVQSSQREAA